jgi:phenylpropionate dioxygenase-like ring-hydroxylating dioxygenase large terminal subunit
MPHRGNAMNDGQEKEIPVDGGMLSVTERNRSKMDAGGVRSLNRQKSIALAKRLIAMVKAGTGTLADGVMEVDTAIYNDPVLYEKERVAIFDKLPFIAGLSRDLEKPGDFLNINEFGTPILVTRNKQGVVKAFVNSCRHRGSALTFCQRGESPGGFSCPYHGWSYSLDGKLIGIAQASNFGTVDKSELGLVEIMAEERHGIIFVATKPGVTFDLGEYLGPEMEEELAQWKLGELAHAKTGPIPLDGNWKLTLEAFLETYHFDVTHKENLAQISHGNSVEIRTLGKHVFFGIPLKSIVELAQLPEEEWVPEEHMMFGYMLYPGILMNITPIIMAFYSLYPVSVNKSGVRHSIYARLDMNVPENRELGENTWESSCGIVMREDLPFGVTSPQAGIFREAVPKFLFGRTELALQHMYKVTQDLLTRAEN